MTPLSGEHISPGLKTESLEVGSWTQGKLTSLGNIGEASLDIIDSNARMSYHKSEGGTIYGVGAMQTITSVEGERGTIVASVDSPTRRMHVQVIREAGNIFSVHADVRRKVGRRYVDGLVVRYQDGVPVALLTSSHMTSDRVLSLLEKSADALAGGNVYLLFKSKNHHVSLKKELITEEDYNRQAEDDIEQGMSSSFSGGKGGSVEVATLEDVTEVRGYHTFPERLPIRGEVLRAVGFLRSLTDGTSRMFPAIKGKETGLGCFKWKGVVRPERGFYDESLDLRARVFIGNERKINMKTHELQAAPPVHYLPLLSSDIHTHPYMTQEEEDIVYSYR